MTAQDNGDDPNHHDLRRERDELREEIERLQERRLRIEYELANLHGELDARLGRAFEAGRLIDHIDPEKTDKSPLEQPGRVPTRGALAQLLSSGPTPSVGSAQMGAYDALINFAQLAARLIVIVNGGAVIAILTFLGHMMASDTASVAELAKLIIPALTFFTGGTASGLVAIWAGYESQLRFTYRDLETDWSAEGYRGFARCVGGVAVACFCLGVFSAMIAMFAADLTDSV